jgi:hypothetical protein
MIYIKIMIINNGKREFLIVDFYINLLKNIFNLFFEKCLELECLKKELHDKDKINKTFYKEIKTKDKDVIILNNIVKIKNEEIEKLITELKKANLKIKKYENSK